MLKDQVEIVIEQPQRKTYGVVFLDRVSSIEYYLQIGYEPEQVLRSINLEIKKGEFWAITGKSKYELKLLLEIIANLKPYHSGKCVLAERGMMRHKRAILPHVFYIGSTSMIYNNMNVLEFLMFVTANKNFDVVSQQERIFEQLISFGLGNVSLTPISTLTAEYKALVLLLVGTYSSSQLIILNIPNLVFDTVQKNAYIKISEYLRSLERTLVISILNPDVIDDIFDHTAVLHDGKLIYKGTTDELKQKYDKNVLTIEDHNIDDIKDRFCQLFPDYDYEIKDEILTVHNQNPDNDNSKSLYDKIIAAGYSADKVKINPKTAKNACEEILKLYDLQK